MHEILGHLFTPAALFILLTASTWTWIIWIDLLIFTLLRCTYGTFILIRTGYLGYFFAFCFLLPSPP